MILHSRLILCKPLFRSKEGVRLTEKTIYFLAKTSLVLLDLLLVSLDDLYHLVGMRWIALACEGRRALKVKGIIYFNICGRE